MTPVKRPLPTNGESMDPVPTISARILQSCIPTATPPCRRCRRPLEDERARVAIDTDVVVEAVGVRVVVCGCRVPAEYARVVFAGSIVFEDGRVVVACSGSVQPGHEPNSQRGVKDK